MSLDGLHAIVGSALVDRKFCETLLSSPELVAPDFDLSEAEFQAVVSIQARSLEEFAAKLDRLIGKGSSKCSETGSLTPRRREAYQLAG